MSIAITIVLPEPVAILEQSLWNSPPSDGISIPVFSDCGASASHIKVSIASNWQKKKRKLSRASVSYQCSRSLFVIPVTPGYPFSLQAFTLGRILLTKGISLNIPGSSNAFDDSEAITYPAGRLPSLFINSLVSRLYDQ